MKQEEGMETDDFSVRHNERHQKALVAHAQGETAAAPLQCERAFSIDRTSEHDDKYRVAPFRLWTIGS
jgi:hypothetical protein